MYEILDKINTPSDIKSLDLNELKQLCKEIRDMIIRNCAENPGHLASSLGAVEQIVAFHYVYDSPKDKLVFDVGHQAYAHKILTGRREAFATLRKQGGISGFPKRSESEYDCFGAGHSSTSVSAALGIAEGARITGSDEKVAAIIGDGAMTGGLAFEGLNNAGISDTDLLVILNDNNQSIEGNVGGLHKHLLRLTTSGAYNSIKTKVWKLLGDGDLRDSIQRWVQSLKSWFVKKSGGDIFESLDFRYFGPIDGNDIEALVKTLRKIKDLRGPRILHCITVKGKGYAAAEADPVTWHAPGRFDPESGELRKSPRKADRYQDVFGEVLCELAEADNKVVGITPAMAKGCGMDIFAKRFPSQFFDVGIAEEHAATFSAGLAVSGAKPFCNIYSSFSQRAYDQIIHDIALQNLPVVLCFDRAGLVGEDGATHQGLYDLAAYRSIPNLVISSPRDEAQLRNLMHTAYHYGKGPFIIRYPRGEGQGVDWRSCEAVTLTPGKAETLLEGSQVAIISCGPVGNAALEAASRHQGRVGVYDFSFIKPLDTEKLEEICSRYKYIVTVEDGCLKGGLYGAVCEYCASRSSSPSVTGIGVPDRFIQHASAAQQWRECGLDVEGIDKVLQKIFGN